MNSAQSAVDISVVIGFKDWGENRLRLAVESLMTSFGSLRGEVIVSDYGSTQCPEVGAMVESLGARHVYTATDGVWSRSRALNAGFAASTGRVLVSTDADMIFSPRAMEYVGLRIAADPSEALVLQCRNLPEGMGSEWIEERGLEWDTFARTATLRPRWGMGGMMATSREAFLDVRGFDERMQIYGGEDIDFAQRVRRSGRRVSWVEDPEVRMYHMWHPSSRTQADETVEGRAAIEYNREILLKDRSFVRNAVEWRHRPADAPPAVSVVISTRNRAPLLGESIYSALAQTVSDLEVLVVDDGSEDDTEKVVTAVDDPRVRYLRSPGRGLACARNFAATHSRARYTVVHDDDDLMMPDRVERHLSALEAGDVGTYGGWVDFDDATGRVVAVNRGKPYSLSNLLFAPGVYAHATLMLETRLIQQVGYDERFASGSDYNLAVRLARLGVTLRHTGHVHLVRRLHGGQVTRVDSATQQSAGRWSTAAVLGLIPAERQNSLRATARTVEPVDVGHDDEAAGELVVPYLPDALVSRDVHVVLPASVPPTLTSDLTDVIEVEDVLHPAHAATICGVLRDATWEQFAAMSRAGRTRVASARRRSSSSSSRTRTSGPVPALDLVRLQAHLRLETVAPTPSALVSGHTARLEADAGPLLLGHWRAGDEDHYLLALPEGDKLLGPLEVSGEHRVERLAARKPTFGGVTTTTTPPEVTVAPAAQAAPGAAAKRAARKATATPTPAKKTAARPTGKAGQKPTKKAAAPGKPAGGKAPQPPVRRAPARSRPTSSVTRARLVGSVLLAVVAVCSAVLGLVAAGPWGALAAAVAGTTLGACTLLAVAYSRRAWHAVDLVERELRGTRGRLVTAIRTDGGRTRKAVSAARAATVKQVKETSDATQASLAKATETLAAAQSSGQTAVESAIASHAQSATEVVRDEVERLAEDFHGRLDESRVQSDATAERLESSVPRATAGLMEVQDRRAAQQQVRQFQSLLSLYSLVRPRAGAPGLGGWAASPDVMLMLANELIARRPRVVVECGSGASTVWLALVARELGISSRIVALEHDEAFAEATRREVERHGLQEVAEIRSAPLRPVDSLDHETAWYEEAAVQDLDDIGLVFVDGPPGTTGPQARFPAVPLLRDRLAQDCVLYLDDAAREDEREVAGRWRELLPDFRLEDPEAEKGVLVFRRGGG